MTGNDLIEMAPWIIFGAGLSALWSRLLHARHTTRHQAERSPRSYTDPAGSGGAAPGRRGRGSVPAAPRHNVYRTWRFGQKVPADGPWGFANSLEWVTSCPPPRHNFTRIPRIRSERPAFDLHYPHIRSGRGRRPVSSAPPGG